MKRKDKYPIKTVRVDELTRGRNTKSEGQVWVLDCPACGETVRILENEATDKPCECGFIWHIVLYGMGVK